MGAAGQAGGGRARTRAALPSSNETEGMGVCQSGRTSVAGWRVEGRQTRRRGHSEGGSGGCGRAAQAAAVGAAGVGPPHATAAPPPSPAAIEKGVSRGRRMRGSTVVRTPPGDRGRSQPNGGHRKQMGGHLSLLQWLSNRLRFDCACHRPKNYTLVSTKRRRATAEDERTTTTSGANEVHAQMRIATTWGQARVCRRKGARSWPAHCQRQAGRWAVGQGLRNTRETRHTQAPQKQGALATREHFTRSLTSHPPLPLLHTIMPRGQRGQPQQPRRT